MKEYTIYAGDKLSGFTDGQWTIFECKPDDIDTAYNVLAERCILKNKSDDSQDLIDFENCKDDNVETMLKDLKRMHFLSNYKVIDVDEWLRKSRP